MDIPITLLISYLTFSFFIYYQQLYAKNTSSSIRKIDFIITLFGFIGMLFQYGFLIYWGYKVSWIDSIILIVVSLLIQSIWFYAEAKFKIQSVSLISKVGLLAVPISGYFMINTLKLF